MEDKLISHNIVFTWDQILEVKSLLSKTLNRVIKEEEKNPKQPNEPISAYSQDLFNSLSEAMNKLNAVTLAHIDSEMAKRKD